MSEERENPGNPRVSIGLPVFNGANFLAEALDSLLAQDYSDFEIILCDNASTDGTAGICKTFAARDPRVRYFRNPLNLGAAPNFNRAFKLSLGEYFRWAAHDDTTAPAFLGKCVGQLDADPGAVLCHSQVRIFDKEGEVLEDHEYLPEMDSDSPLKRFHDLLFTKNRCFEVFGLIRSSVLKKTHLMGSFPVGDRVLLAELAFHGRFHEIPERLFFSRDHAGRSVRQLATQQERATWFDARYKGKLTFPEWRTFVEYLKAIHRSPLSFRQRLGCYRMMVKWLYWYKNRMVRDLLFPFRRRKAGRKGLEPNPSWPEETPHSKAQSPSEPGRLPEEPAAESEGATGGMASGGQSGRK
ncbi:MAG: glycosyltransferase family 2 protein [Planctomycetota bacterium]